MYKAFWSGQYSIAVLVITVVRIVSSAPARSTAELLVRMARARGLWVHVGRVNTMGRLARVEAMGADSFDGGQLSRFPDNYIPPFLARLE